MEDGKWKMGNGRWEMVNRRWKMENGKWVQIALAMQLSEDKIKMKV